jgi:tyrosyl-tRNA synthetase
MYGGIMSFPDEVITAGFELLTTVSLPQIEEMEKQLKMEKTNPMILKKRLAKEIVSMLYSEEKAEEAEKEFERVFQKGEAPNTHISIYEYPRKQTNIIDLLVESKLAPSNSEAKRLVEQGAVEIDGEKISDIRYQISVKDGTIIKAGKRRFVKIHLSV